MGEELHPVLENLHVRTVTGREQYNKTVTTKWKYRAIYIRLLKGYMDMAGAGIGAVSKVDFLGNCTEFTMKAM